jgi:hypothetical protein
VRALRLGLLAPILLGCYGDVELLGETAEGGGSAADPPPDLGDTPANQAQFTCAPAEAAPPDGHHYPGTACLSCHGAGVGPAFTLAGTLFGDAGGAQPVAGATIHVLDASLQELTIVTGAGANAGNFWTDVPVTFPLSVAASTCPDVTPMPTQAPIGDCNSCHRPDLTMAMAFP